MDLSLKNTIDAALSVKEFIKNSLTAKKSVVVTSLDVKGAFDAAWWPSILFNLKNLNCPRNLYNLVRDYFHNRSATLSFNSCVAMKKVTKGCPQGSCCGPGLWNVLYNSLLNLEFTPRTRVIAFADDIIVLTKGADIVEAEEYANQDLKKNRNLGE